MDSQSEFGFEAGINLKKIIQWKNREFYHSKKELCNSAGFSHSSDVSFFSEPNFSRLEFKHPLFYSNNSIP